jgi:hypothetical protein
MTFEQILEGINVKLAKRDFEKLPKVKLLPYTFEDYLQENPPALTARENIWYYYIPAILRGAAILFRGTVAGNAAEMLSLIKGGNMSPKAINATTNVIGLILAILEPVRSYLTEQPFEWGTFAVCILGAIVAYFTGKSTLADQKGR